MLYDTKLSNLGNHPENVVPFPTLQSLFRGQMIERIQHGHALFWEGDEAKHIFEVVDGMFRIFKIVADGRRVITGFLYPGDLLGVSIKDRYIYNAEAIGNTKVRRVAKRVFQDRVGERLDLRSQLFSRLCDEMAAAQDQIVLLSRKNADARVCHFLLEIYHRTKESQPALTISLPMTRQDMADYLGLTIETVSRTMTKLVDRNMIAYIDRRMISIRRLNILEAMSDESNEQGNDCLMNQPHH